MNVFDRELAEMETITGLSIGDESTPWNYVLSIRTSSTRRVIRTTWYAPEPWKLGRVDWVYLYGLGYWALHWMVR